MTIRIDVAMNCNGLLESNWLQIQESNGQLNGLIIVMDCSISLIMTKCTVHVKKCDL